jgi:hypothetical protein
MAFFINGKEVEYLHIEYDYDGDEKDTIVTYSEKFNLATAHMGDIMQRLRKNNLNNVLVFKDFKHEIISITYRDVGQVSGILHSLGLPYGCYEVLENDRIIVVDIPVLDRLLSEM